MNLEPDYFNAYHNVPPNAAERADSAPSKLHI